MLNVQPVLLQVLRIAMKASHVSFSLAAIALLFACAAPAHCRELKQAAASGGLPGLPRLLAELELVDSSLRAQVCLESMEFMLSACLVFRKHIAKPVTLRTDMLTARAVTSSVFKIERA